MRKTKVEEKGEREVKKEEYSKDDKDGNKRKGRKEIGYIREI